MVAYLLSVADRWWPRFTRIAGWWPNKRKIVAFQFHLHDLQQSRSSGDERTTPSGIPTSSGSRRCCTFVRSAPQISRNREASDLDAPATIAPPRSKTGRSAGSLTRNLELRPSTGQDRAGRDPRTPLGLNCSLYSTPARSPRRARTYSALRPSMHAIRVWPSSQDGVTGPRDTRQKNNQRLTPAILEQQTRPTRLL